MPRARDRTRCGVWARTRGRICGAPAVFDGRCKQHGGNATGLRAPWTLTQARGELAAFPAHQHPREPHVRRRSRVVRPWMAADLIRRGIITRAVFLADSSKPDRFLRRIERDGIRVEAEPAELVRAYRFVLPKPVCPVSSNGRTPDCGSGDSGSTPDVRTQAGA